MMLTQLRLIRDNLYEKLLKYDYLDDLTPTASELDKCCRGEVDEFVSKYQDWVVDDDDESDEGTYEWVDPLHERFYISCMEVKRAENKEYHAALAR